jgi:signal transduction histidine kinase
MVEGAQALIASLRGTLGRMEVALGAIPEGIAWTTEEGVVQWSNAVFDRLVGRSRFEILGARLADCLPLRQEGKAVRGIARMSEKLLSGAAPEAETFEYAKESEGLSLEIYVGLALAGESTRSLVFVIRDVTERVRRQRELLQAQADIEDAHRSLLRQEHLAAIGRMAASVIHHVANPMAYVTANLDLMRRDIQQAVERGALRHDTAQMIEEALDGVQRVNKVLDALRPYARRSDWTGEPVDIGAAFEAAIALVAPDAAGRVEIRVSVRGVPLVKGRSQEIAQVLHSLLEHVVRAAADGGHVDVSAVVSGEKLVVEIARDGPAMPPAELERLFEPFAPSSVVAAEARQQRDLGLWTARAIAREHGGDLTVDSPGGRGAAFRLTLPLPPRPPPPAAGF